MSLISGKTILLGAVVMSSVLIIMLGHDFMKLNTGLQPGDKLPRGRLESFDGHWVDTGLWRGFPTLLVLVSSTCPACLEEIEGLAALAPEFPELNVVLLSTDGMFPKTVAPFTVYRDPSGDFLNRARRRIVPTLYLVDSQGSIRYARVGLRSRSTELRLLRSFLSEGSR